MKKKLTTLYIELEQWNEIKQLSASTKVPMSVYMREGITMALNKYRSTWGKGLQKSPSSQTAVPG